MTTRTTRTTQSGYMFECIACLTTKLGHKRQVTCDECADEIRYRAPKIIIVNGPPNSGKDEAVTYLRRHYGVHAFSFKTELKALTLKLFCVQEALWDSWYTREGKELPRLELGGRSARQALIYVSERVVKPNFGKGWFGLVEAKKLEAISEAGHGLIAAASDGGFNEEVLPITDTFGSNNVHVLRVHRPGCSYDGDSRNWIDTSSVPDQNYHDIHNDEGLEKFWTELRIFYKVHILNK